MLHLHDNLEQSKAKILNKKFDNVIQNYNFLFISPNFTIEEKIFEKRKYSVKY